LNRRVDVPTKFLKKNLLAKVQSRSDVGTDQLIHTSNVETDEMKSALIGTAAVAAAAFVTPALAQAVVADPGSCSHFYYSANCPNFGADNPYTDGNYYRDRQNANVMMSRQAAEPGAYRYHGGPKYND
jgi:hypothetical protein